MATSAAPTATPIGTLTEVLDMVDYVLVMSVNPGFGGQKFIGNALEKMRKLAAIRAAIHRDFMIEVDGGITLNNIAQVVQAGAEIIVTGNAVFGAGEAKQVGNFIADVLEHPHDEGRLEGVKKEVMALCARFPVYGPAMRKSYGMAEANEVPVLQR